MTKNLSASRHAHTGSSPAINKNEQRRVVAGTTIGTAIEWYDYFIYANVAGIVFNHIMFSEDMGRGLATILSFLTVGISFLFRPLGAFLAGHFADKHGRRIVLMVTLIAMGSATVLIGLLPTYETVGIWAPAALIFLRIVQGISAGGEWGSAVLLAVEHAPTHKRGLYGAGPQVGVPIGLLMASGTLTIMNWIAPGDAFMQWGWRVPFLLSILLILVGLLIRRGVSESPVYAEMNERPDLETTKNPVKVLFKQHTGVLFAAAFVLAANGAVGYMTVGGFIQSYATNSEGLAMDRGQVLGAVTLSAATWTFTTLFAGWLSDRITRKHSLGVGFLLQALGVLALFPLINTGSITNLTIAVVFLTVGLGLTYGQISAMYTEVYPASIRSSGASINYAIASILGGAFAPMIAASLVEATGGTRAVTIYLMIMTGIGALCLFLLRDRTGIPLQPDYEEVQSTGHFIWQQDWREALAEFEASQPVDASTAPNPDDFDKAEAVVQP